MNPEVIKLFDEKKSKKETSPELTNEFDSLSQALVEARQKLEHPLRQLFKRSNQLEKELLETRSAFLKSQENQKHGREQIRVLKEQLEKLHDENLNFKNKTSALENHNRALMTNREKILSALNREQKTVYDTTARLKLMTEALEKRESEFRQTSRVLTHYQNQWKLVIENDRRLREIIHQQQSTLRTRVEEQKILAAAEKLALENRVEQLLRDKQMLEKQLALQAKELQTEHAALRTTSEALQNYQVQWNTILNTDRQLKLRVSQLEQELVKQRAMVSRFGPIEDRALLARRDEEYRSEIERLRSQLVAKASLERELDEQRAQNEAFLKEFTRESHRYRELADQDHANQLALWEKLKQAENAAEALRKGAQILT